MSGGAAKERATTAYDIQTERLPANSPSAKLPLRLASNFTNHPFKKTMWILVRRKYIGNGRSL